MVAVAAGAAGVTGAWAVPTSAAAPPAVMHVIDVEPDGRLADASPVSRSPAGSSDATTATITLAVLLLATGLACIGGSHRRGAAPREPRRRA